MALKPDGLCVYETAKQDSISFQCIFNIDSLFYYIEFFEIKKKIAKKIENLKSFYCKLKVYR